MPVAATQMVCSWDVEDNVNTANVWSGVQRRNTAVRSNRGALKGQ
jgi:hypothetical protein